MKYLKYIVVILLFPICSCNNINCLESEKVKFKDLPIEVINCIKNPQHFREEINSMLITLPKDTNSEYKVENVETWIGPWVSYVKLINIKTNDYYKINQGVPYPYFIFENKLYVPDRYNIFTTVDDLGSLEFTSYILK